jgi:hypothetical protein
MKIQLCKGTKVYKHGTGLVSVDALADTKFQVMDWYGNVREANVVYGGTSKRHTLRAVSGENIYVGAEHELLSREMGKGRYERVPAAKMETARFVRLPQRKIRCDKSLFDCLEADEHLKRVYLKPERAGDFYPLCEAAATAGISVHRHKSELRVDIEMNRPSCFASKLIMGNFYNDLPGTLDDLVGSGIVSPCAAFNDRYIDMCEAEGIIFEGSTLFNDVMVTPAIPSNNDVDVYNVYVEHDDVPLELTWFCT